VSGSEILKTGQSHNEPNPRGMQATRDPALGVRCGQTPTQLQHGIID
jgi:hypothetical protein